MKRDWNILKAILEEAEGETLYESIQKLERPGKTQGVGKLEVAMRDVSPDNVERTLYGHIRLLTESGMLDGIQVQSVNQLSVGHVFVTMAGHDLLECLRHQSTWDFIVRQARQNGFAMTFETLKILAIEFVKRSF